MGIAPLYDQPAYERWRPRYDRDGDSDAIPANALLNEDGTPLRAEDGTILLKEPE